VSIYLDGATVEECRDLLGRGERLEVLASRLRISPDDLARLLGLHAGRNRSADVTCETDLWAGCERLDGIL
jgi:hypothetical protein